MPPAIKVKGNKVTPIETEQPNTFVRNTSIPNKQVYNNNTPSLQKLQTITLTGNLTQTSSTGSVWVFQVNDGDATIEVSIE